MTHKKPIIDKPFSEDLAPYSDQELQFTLEIEKKIENLMKFFDERGIDYDKFDKSSKKAYPNNDVYQHVPGAHDTKKWLEAIKDIYYKERNGSNRGNAIRQVTFGWNVMETFDFLNWVKFHEAGEHMKYKFAQTWYENGSPGYFLHVKPDPVKEEKHVSGKDIDFAKESVVVDENKKQIIERQRNKMMGRLDSAEKLLRTQEGQLFAGKDFAALLEAIYNLKKQIHTVNKMSSSIRLYEDMIIRQANILNKAGMYKAGDFLNKIAQANNPPPDGTGVEEETPLTPVTPAPPTQPTGNVGGLPTTGPGSPTIPPDSVNENSPVGKFLNNLETGNISTVDESNSDDLEVVDSFDVDDSILVVEAQAIPAAPGAPKAPVIPSPAVKEEEPLEVTEDVTNAPTGAVTDPTDGTDFGHKVDQVFADVTVTDVITEFEFISNFYKAREIPRRLSRADMMLDALGLASFFPSLAEAQNKALDSNNYISSRVDEILSKLRGSIKSNETNLSVEKTEVSPEVAGIKNKLQSDEDKEKARKQQRKEQENADLDKSKETPEIEVSEDLATPTAPAKPAAPPAV